ncbi:hypothetical protein C2845_PM01G18300 [Panicum miliaceum]|uniref:40S ribosomal protein S19 n=1 Tax=Panicum miliaceum TaxID=4540 RepID=A0A3L6TJS7_PANMI|nr:hypothetical protein C2845_PM01G18300 [Panicum miliaceum]
MECRSAPSAGCLDVPAEKLILRMREIQRENLETDIKEMMEQDKAEGTTTMPPPQIVKYFDLLGKAWGWKRLLPFAGGSWSDYSKYLEEYYQRNAVKLVPGAAAATGSSIAALAEICIAKEADLTCELLRRGASYEYDYLLEQSSEIRMCVLSLMNCTSCHSVAASAAMLGVSKEAEMMCKWMNENDMLLDVFDDDLPNELETSRTIRFQTLYLMIDILKKSSAPAGNKIDEEEFVGRNDPSGVGNGIAADEATNITWGSVSDVLDSQDQKKIEDAKKISGDFLEKAWGWESHCLEEYPLPSKFVAEVAANLNPDWLLDSADPAVAKSCILMEEELVSEWKKHVISGPHKILPVNTFIQSCLIKECALSILGDKFSVPSGIAFVCITKEADLMLELLRHGAKPTDDMIHQSSVVRMCALGFVNLKGCQSVAAAAAMMGMAKEAKIMCDWMKRENKLLTFNMSELPELEVARFIRGRTLDVMINILQECSFPSSKYGLGATTAAYSVNFLNLIPVVTFLIAVLLCLEKLAAAPSTSLLLLTAMELPEWVDIVKTARFKELPPYDPDWYYTRAASIARKIYLRQGIGVGGFQKIYGGRQRNGSRPPHFCKSSGAISRNILQQLQKMGIIDVDPKGGRLITSQGRRDLDQVAGRVAVEA